jgi:4-carboxymuconolactone decarboxylase
MSALLDDPEARRAAAREVLVAMFGEQFHEAFRGMMQEGQFCAPLAKLTYEFCFGRIWGGPELERKTRSIVTISILMALRQTSELKNHIRAGLANGISVAELEGIIMQAVAYLGFAAAGPMLEAASAALRESGQMPQQASPKERGLL